MVCPHCLGNHPCRFCMSWSPTCSFSSLQLQSRPTRSEVPRFSSSELEEARSRFFDLPARSSENPEAGRGEMSFVVEAENLSGSFRDGFGNSGFTQSYRRDLTQATRHKTNPALERNDLESSTSGESSAKCLLSSVKKKQCGPHADGCCCSLGSMTL